MGKNNGKGLLGFLAGITAGGVVTLLTATRKGSEVRKDLAKEWAAGKAGTDTLKKELSGMAGSMRTIFDEVKESPQFSEASAKLQKGFEEAKGRAEALIEEAEAKAEAYRLDAMERAEKLRTEAEAKAQKLFANAKTAIMEGKEELLTPKTKKRATGGKKKAPAKKTAAKK
ncbi:hypothetical protein COW46_01985 [Candidatus Gracilibacteria bacterium CG17_big_fil_post_rev_8_21_14_2_50_48_13]|nr:MAG: hypothetical protein COW46_01985 [Candidatus Gracilibacteria bacterium CG17_big_fil_post_rev_8_21_14_2_50_48_13]